MLKLFFHEMLKFVKIIFQSIFDVNSQVTWNTKLVTYILSILKLALTDLVFITLGCTSDSDCRDPSARCNIAEGKCQNVLCPELNIPNSKIEKKDTLVAGDSVNVSKYFWVGSHGLLVNQLNLPRVIVIYFAKY